MADETLKSYIGVPSSFDINSAKSRVNAWSLYADQFDIFLMVNKITEPDEKRNLMLALMGTDAFALLQSLCAPTDVKTLSLAVIKTHMKSHFEPELLVTTERYKFNKRNQQPGESAADYIAELRRMSTTCAFPCTLEQAIRDRIVCGIRNDKVRKKLLREPNLTLDNTVKLVLADELTSQESKNMSELDLNDNPTDASESATHKISARKPTAHASKFKPQSADSCHRCGGDHDEKSCGFRNAKCFSCGKIGHIIKVCRKQKQKTAQKASRVQQVEAPESDSSDDCDINRIDVDALMTDTTKFSTPPPFMVDVQLNGTMHTFEWDTGSHGTIIDETKRRELKLPAPEATKLSVRAYGGTKIKVLGLVEVSVQFKGKTRILPLVIVKSPGSSIFGRNWMEAFGMNPAAMLEVHQAQVHVQPNFTIGKCKTGIRSRLEGMLEKYKHLFNEDGGTEGPMKEFKASLKLKRDARPVFFKPRPLPFALKPLVDDELDRLEKFGIIEKVETSDWASPIVPVIKPGKVRICGDFKVTVNPQLDIHEYPLPCHEELFNIVSGCESFSKLDWSDAYLQMELDEESKKFCVITTHRGLYRYNRLPFGIASSPAIFQKAIEQVVAGLDRVGALIDDVVVAGESDEIHLQNLEKLFQRLDRFHVTLKASKSEFLMQSMKYLGLRVTKKGLAPDPQRIQPILNMPEPADITQLRSFFGMLQMYQKFIRNFADLASPLYELLKKGVPFHMGKRQKESFKKLKEALVSHEVLAHYDPTKPLTIACDASSYGLGVAMTQTFADGDRPIAFASKRLTSTELNYSQIEREALSIIYGVKKFHRYLYGRHFQLLTDHKPLETIFGPKVGLPPIAAMRIQRWAMFLMAYDFTVKYRSTKQHCDCDALSRLPVGHDVQFEKQEEQTARVEVKMIQATPLDSKSIRSATKTDKGFQKLIRFVRHGFPDKISDNFKPYLARSEQLTVTEEGTVMFGERVVVPAAVRQSVLDELHAGHAGIESMKKLARSLVWWPALDQDILKVVQSCSVCQQKTNKPAAQKGNTWPECGPWGRLHIDLLDLEGRTWMVVYDAGSKWPALYWMRRSTSSDVIRCFRKLFCDEGLPLTIVSDNGPQFISEEFEKFCESNSITHLTSASYHPSSNGSAERFVETVKRALSGSKDPELDAARFLLRYRNTPHSTTGVAPAIALKGHLLRSRIHSLQPRPHIPMKQTPFDPSRELTVGTKVYVRWAEKKWIKGIVRERMGQVLYKVESNGVVEKRHIDQLRRRDDSSKRSEAPSPPVQQEETGVRPKQKSVQYGRAPTVHVHVPQPIPQALPPANLEEALPVPAQPAQPQPPPEPPGENLQQADIPRELRTPYPLRNQERQQYK